MYICCVHFMLISFKVCKQACNLQDLSNTNVNKFIETFAIQRIVLIFLFFRCSSRRLSTWLDFLLYIFSFVQLAGCLPTREKKRSTQANWKGESQYRWHQGLISKTKQRINLRRRENPIEHSIYMYYICTRIAVEMLLW